MYHVFKTFQVILFHVFKHFSITPVGLNGCLLLPFCPISTLFHCFFIIFIKLGREEFFNALGSNILFINLSEVRKLPYGCIGLSSCIEIIANDHSTAGTVCAIRCFITRIYQFFRLNFFQRNTQLICPMFFKSGSDIRDRPLFVFPIQWLSSFVCPVGLVYRKRCF